jgi:hypothetical protein
MFLYLNCGLLSLLKILETVTVTIIRCTKSPAVNPYVVVATGMVKGCPQHGMIELDNCRNCNACMRVQD